MDLWLHRLVLVCYCGLVVAQACTSLAQPKAPLIPMCVISVPYERLAVDIVGPLTRTKSGYKYLLTVYVWVRGIPMLFHLDEYMQ